jgi:hypothetical protein
VNINSAPDRPSRGFFSILGGVFKGIGQSLWGTVEGLYHTIRHPIRTVEGLYNLVRHPIRSAKAIGQAIEERINAIASGDPEAIGKTIGDILTAVVAPEAEGEEVAAKALPELEISAGKYPELAENILHAQKAGHPSILTHGGVGNRAKALDEVPNVIKFKNDPRRFTRDEYPFNSAKEGGAGAWVGHVPEKQQHAQGALLHNLYAKHKLKPGDKYRVIITK